VTKVVGKPAPALKSPLWAADAGHVDETNGSQTQVVEATVSVELTISEAGALRAWLLKPTADGSTALDDALVNVTLKKIGGALDRVEAVATVRRELEDAGFSTHDLGDEQVAELGRRIGQVSQLSLR
jgi:hypothetical protein